MIKCPYCEIPANSKQQLAMHIRMRHDMKEDRMGVNNFSKQMDLMGQITALLKVEMHVTAERMMLEAELAKLKEEHEDQ